MVFCCQQHDKHIDHFSDDLCDKACEQAINLT